LAVAKILALFFIDRFIIGNFTIIPAFGGGTDDPLAGNGNWLRGGGEDSKVGSKFVPLGNVKVLGNDEVFGERRSIDNLDTARRNCATKFLVNGDEGAGELFVIGKSESWKVRTIALSRDLADLTKSSNGLADDTTSFRVTNGSFDLDQAGKQLGDERSDRDVRVYKLGHIVDNAKKYKINKRSLICSK
jgi:hypothetical protein